MSPFTLRLRILLAATLAVSGCGQSEPTGDATPLTEEAVVATSDTETEAEQGGDASTTESLSIATDTTSSQGVGESISEARKRLEAGEFDTAAAELLKLQIGSSQFNADDAAAYREVLSQTMTAAIAAAEKGDPRGQAAMQLLRATRRR